MKQDCVLFKADIWQLQGEQSVYRFRFARSGSWSQLCPGFYVYPESPHVFSPLCCWRKMSIKVNPILDVLCQLVFIYLLMYFSHVLATTGSVFMSVESWLTGWCPVQIVSSFGACINIKTLMAMTASYFSYAASPLGSIDQQVNHPQL